MSHKRVASTIAGIAKAVPADRWLSTIAMCVGIGLAVWGQHGIRSPALPRSSLLLFATGVTLAVLGAVPMLGAALSAPDRGTESRPTAAGNPLPAARSRGRPLVASLAVAGVGLGVLAFQLNSDNRFTLPGVLVWAASILMFMAAFWERPEAVRDKANPGPSAVADWARRWSGASALALLSLLGVLALAGFFRFYRLDTVPFDMNSDHVEKLLDIRNVLGGQFNVFFANNGGREPMEFYLVGGLIKFFGMGLEFLTLKVAMASVGLMLLPVTYLLILEIWGSRMMAVLSASFLAVSHWAVSTSRVGLRFAFAPLLAALTLLFLIRGLRSLRTSDFLLAGLFLGLGMYGYQAFRVMPLAVVACIALRLGATLWRRERDQALRLLGNSGVMVALSLLVYAPMARFWQQFPDQYWQRYLTRATGAEAESGNRLLTFLGNLKGLALMFNWKGDVVWVYNVPDSPTLDYVMGALFVVGFLLVLVRGISHRDLTAAYTVGAFAILLVPSALALTFPRENPSISRAGAALPLAMGFVALPVYLVMERLRQLPWRRMVIPVAGVGIAGLLAVTAFANYQWYFQDYAEQYRHSIPNHREIAASIEDFVSQGGSIDRAYIRTWPYWLDHRAIALTLGDPDWDNNLTSLDEVRQVASEGGPRFFVLHPDDEESLDWLQSYSPQGVTEWHTSIYDHDFVTFLLPQAASPTSQQAFSPD
jgi:hypothetical protein